MVSMQFMRSNHIGGGGSLEGRLLTVQLPAKPRISDRRACRTSFMRFPAMSSSDGTFSIEVQNHTFCLTVYFMKVLREGIYTFEDDINKSTGKISAGHNRSACSGCQQWEAWSANLLHKTDEHVRVRSCNGNTLANCTKSE